jgi:hypothetical protein
MLLVHDRQGEIVKGDILLEQCMRSDQKIDIPERETIQNAFSGRTAFPARQDCDTNSSGLRERGDGCKVLPGENFSRRHECSLPSGFDDGSGGNQCDYRFAGPNVALQETQHSLWAGEVGNDVVDGFLLGVRERVRERFQDAGAETPFTRTPAARLPTHVRAHQCQRELARKQFIIG